MVADPVWIVPEEDSLVHSHLLAGLGLHSVGDGDVGGRTKLFQSVHKASVLVKGPLSCGADCLGVMVTVVAGFCCVLVSDVLAERAFRWYHILAVWAAEAFKTRVGRAGLIPGAYPVDGLALCRVHLCMVDTHRAFRCIALLAQCTLKQELDLSGMFIGRVPGKGCEEPKAYAAHWTAERLADNLWIGHSHLGGGRSFRLHILALGRGHHGQTC